MDLRSSTLSGYDSFSMKMNDGIKPQGVSVSNSNLNDQIRTRFLPQFVDDFLPSRI